MTPTFKQLSTLKAFLFLVVFLFASQLSSRAATVLFNFTNEVTGLPDTNTVKILPIIAPVMADGTVLTGGPSYDIKPDTNGFASLTLLQGDYLITNAFLGKGIVFAVPQSRSTYSLQQLAISGYNTYNYTPGVNLITSSNGTVNVIYLPHGVTDLSITNVSGFPLTADGDLAGFNLTNGGFAGVHIGNGYALTNLNLLQATNNDLRLSLNATNQSLLIGFNATNYALLLAELQSFNVRTLGTNSTNFALLIGANGTNEALLIGLNATNNDLRIGLNATNNDLLFGLNSTNEALLIGANVTNFANALIAFGKISIANITNDNAGQNEQLNFAANRLPAGAGRNTAYGVNAGANLGAVLDNTFVGANAGSQSAGVSASTGVGSGALKNDNGNNNTAVGRNAMDSPAFATYSVAIGDNALHRNNKTTGTMTGNTVVGAQAYASGTNDFFYYNTLLGYQAGTFGNSSVPQLGNVGIGANALWYGFGQYNTVLGFESGGGKIIGNANTIVGSGSGYFTDGSGNILLGTALDAPNGGGSGQLNIGNLIQGSGITAGGWRGNASSNLVQNGAVKIGGSLSTVGPIYASNGIVVIGGTISGDLSGATNINLSSVTNQVVAMVNAITTNAAFYGNGGYLDLSNGVALLTNNNGYVQIGTGGALTAYTIVAGEAGTDIAPGAGIIRGSFFGNGAGITNLTVPNSGVATNGAVTGFFANSITNTNNLSTATLTVLNGATIGGTLTNSSLTANSLVVAGANKQLASVAATSTNQVVHGSASGPVFAAVTEYDLTFSTNTTGNATAFRHGLMPGGNNNQNTFYNGQAQLTGIPDAALSTNVALKNAANTFTAPVIINPITVNGNGLDVQASAFQNPLLVRDSSGVLQFWVDRNGKPHGDLSLSTNLPLTAIQGGGATVGYVLTWNGSEWAPAPTSSGGMTTNIGFVVGTNLNQYLSGSGVVLNADVSHAEVTTAITTLGTGITNGAVLNLSNYVLAVSQNATNNTTALGNSITNGGLNSLSNYVLAISQNATNQALLIGARDTNQSLLIGQNATNQSLLIGLNATNNTAALGTSITNGGLLVLSNYVLTLSQNATNNTAALGTSLTNGGLNALSNYVLTISQNATNQTLLIGARATNQSLLIGLNATNNAIALGNSITNGGLNALSNYVLTISQNATNYANSVTNSAPVYGSNITADANNAINFNTNVVINGTLTVNSSTNTDWGSNGVYAGWLVVSNSLSAATIYGNLANASNYNLINATNYALLVGANATNEVTRKANTILTNGAFYGAGGSINMSNGTAAWTNGNGYVQVGPSGVLTAYTIVAGNDGSDIPLGSGIIRGAFYGNGAGISNLTVSFINSGVLTNKISGTNILADANGAINLNSNVVINGSLTVNSSTNTDWGSNGVYTGWLIVSNTLAAATIYGNLANASNYNLINATNYALLIGQNATNQSLLIGLNSTNNSTALGASITNGGLLSLSNYVLTISQNATNYANIVTNSAKVYGSNILVDANNAITFQTNVIVNGTLTFNSSTNTDWGSNAVYTGWVAASNSISAATIYGSLANASNYNLINATNNDVALGTSITNGGITQLSNYVLTVSQNATNFAKLTTNNLQVFGSNVIGAVSYVSGTLTNTVANSQKLNTFGTGSSGNWWGIVPVVDGSGFMEVGRYVDFHNIGNDTADNSVRLETGGSTTDLFVNGNKIVNATNISAYLQNATNNDIALGTSITNGGLLSLSNYVLTISQNATNYANTAAKVYGSNVLVDANNSINFQTNVVINGTLTVNSATNTDWGSNAVYTGWLAVSNTLSAANFITPTNAPADGYVLTASGTSGATKWAVSAGGSGGTISGNGTNVTFYGVTTFGTNSGPGLTTIDGTGNLTHYSTNAPLTVFYDASTNALLSVYGSNSVVSIGGLLSATNAVFFPTNTYTPAANAAGGYLWNSNKVLFWITNTKTNMLSDGR